MTDEEPPQPPEKPDPDDCCGGSCTPCIFEIYNEELSKYQEQMLEWEKKRQPPSG